MDTGAFWTEFLSDLVARGLLGVQLAISDAHPGFKDALATVHDALGTVVRSIFTPNDGAEARRRLVDAFAPTCSIVILS